MEKFDLIKNFSSTICVFGLLMGVPLCDSSTMLVNGDYNTPSAIFQEIDTTASISKSNTQKNWYDYSQLSKLDYVIKDTFGYMRDPTTAEQESVKNYIKDISEKTGVSFFELC